MSTSMGMEEEWTPGFGKWTPMIGDRITHACGHQQWRKTTLAKDKTYEAWLARMQARDCTKCATAKRPVKECFEYSPDPEPGQPRRRSR